MIETMTVRRKDNGKLKIINTGNFDPSKHKLLDAPKVEKMVVDKPTAGVVAIGDAAPEPVDVPRQVEAEINVIEPAPIEKPKRGRKTKE